MCDLSFTTFLSGGLLLLASFLILWSQYRKKFLEYNERSGSILQELETMPLPHENNAGSDSAIGQYNDLRSSLYWYLDQQKTLDRFSETYRTLVRREHHLRFIAWCLSRNGYHVEIPGLLQNSSIPSPDIIARNTSGIIFILCPDAVCTHAEYSRAQQRLLASKALYESGAENTLEVRIGTVTDAPFLHPDRMCHGTGTESATVQLRLFPLLHFYPSLFGKHKSLYAPGESDYDRQGLTGETLCFYTLEEFESYLSRHYGTLPALEQDEDFLKLLLQPEKGTVAPSPYKHIFSENSEEAEKKNDSFIPLQELLDQASGSLPFPDSSSF